MVDAVLEWLADHPVACVPLDHQARFELDFGGLEIQSNHEDVIALAGEQFRYYPTPAIQTVAGPCLAIEIYYVGATGDEQGVVPGPHWRRPAAAAHPDDDLAYGFQQLSADGADCLWRPFDTLISCTATERGRIRVLAGDSRAGDHADGIRGFRMKEPGIDVEQVVDLIKVLYVRFHGLFCLHAAALAWGEHGVIVTGPSGSGKTTTALALLRGGFHMLSDEFALIDAPVSGAVRISGLLVPPRIVGSPLDSLDKLESSLGSTDGLEKAPFNLSPATVQSGRRRALEPKAVIVLDPERSNGTDHRLCRIEIHEAFVALMRLVLDVTGISRREAQADALIALLKAARAHRLALGRDLTALPSLITACMEEPAP